MNKKLRHQRILDIIDTKAVETQEALAALLVADGIDVTQATVSRDIRELRLIKINLGNGRIKYSKPLKAPENKRFSAIFGDAVISADYALNTVVLKCHAGMAQAACAALDAVEFPDIVGTLAGDDTIFVLMRTETKAQEFTVSIMKMLKNG